MGFRASTASIFVCLDSDMTCSPNFLRTLVEALEKHRQWVAAEGRIIPTGGKDSPLWDAPTNDGSNYLSGASAYRAEALNLAGGFDEEFLLPACEDADLAARLLKIGKYGYVAEAVAYHPTRRVTLGTHWRWRRYWKYEMILAKRHGFLAFPGRPAGRFPRLRVALAAVVTLPSGRFIEGLRYLKREPLDGILACLYALFDIFCGIWALPDILFAPVPPRRNYLANREGEGTHPGDSPFMAKPWIS